MPIQLATVSEAQVGEDPRVEYSRVGVDDSADAQLARQLHWEDYSPNSAVPMGLDRALSSAARSLSRDRGGALCADAPEVAIDLPHDLYSIAIVEGVSAFSSLILPLLAAIFQSSALYLIAFSHENLFDEGHWLEPVSKHMWVDVMKIISTLVSLFKISSEMQQAQQLCRALLVGHFRNPYKRLCGWWALALQYTMALFVLFVAFSTVLAGQSTTACIVRIFTVFIVIDMDNLAARFLEVLYTMDFSVATNMNLLAAERQREALLGGTFMKLCFFMVPLVVLSALALSSIINGTLPLTAVRYGYVSNKAAPEMLTDVEGGCCPPIQSGHGLTSVNYSVLLLAPLDEPAPIVFWVAVPTEPEPKAPSSLQVKEGCDGDGNDAAFSGSQEAKPVQAHYWLQSHGFSNRTYAALLHQEHLYRRSMPYNASIILTNLAPLGTGYRVYATAQSTRTRALAPQPIISERFITSICASYCDSCAMTGKGFCDRCVEGTYRTEEGICVPCTDNCLRCTGANSSKGSPIQLLQRQLGGKRPCDHGECAAGFGINDNGDCNRCEIEHCDACDLSESRCSSCASGFGLAHDRTKCTTCAHPRCICSEAGGCDTCEKGWGLTKRKEGTCRECPKGCAECMFAHANSCLKCQAGFAMHGSHCLPCTPHCLNCTTSGPEKCDECDTGFGYNDDLRQCRSCNVPHCRACDDPRLARCTHCEIGFGVTPEGLCDTCGEFCERCSRAGTCLACAKGYALENGNCWSCADGCAECILAGPARCDVCLPGFYLDRKERTCLPVRRVSEI